MAKNHALMSIIVPTFNRPESLADCLQALAGLDYPRDCFEVIVVDDGSDSTPADAVSTVASQIDVQLVRQANAGPAAARNRGVEIARGEFLCFLDDDCLAAPDWLNKLRAGFGETTNAALGGKTVDAPPGNTYSRASQAILDAVYSYYARSNQVCFFATSNLAVPADLCREVGGFDERFSTSEDREFCDRWQLCGHRLVFVPEALVYHMPRLTFGRFLRRHFHYGRGAWRFEQNRVGGQSRRPEAGLGLHLYLLWYSLSTGRSLGAIWITAWVVIARAAYVAGYLWERMH